MPGLQTGSVGVCSASAFVARRLRASSTATGDRRKSAGKQPASASIRWERPVESGSPASLRRPHATSVPERAMTCQSIRLGGRCVKRSAARSPLDVLEGRKPGQMNLLYVLQGKVSVRYAGETHLMSEG